MAGHRCPRLAITLLALPLGACLVIAPGEPVFMPDPHAIAPPAPIYGGVVCPSPGAGALAGAWRGMLGGALIGSFAGEAGRGAAIGAGVGAIAGAVAADAACVPQ